MLKSITFEVVGDQQLVCEGCEERVEHVLKTVQGVGKVRAHARNQRIEVLFDAAMLDAAKIAERIGKAGYQTRVVSPTSDSANSAKSRVD
ncbi:cation transporter [candidate division KSB1 bacterium]|nr:cation transporter [candidate division KSB1 bacterium]